MTELLFIYNADSGLANGLLDVGRRVFTPEAYPCALCMVTYEPFGMKKDWKSFVESLPYPARFLHKDELSSELNAQNLSFPCLLLQTDGDYTVIMTGSEFEDIKDLETLKRVVTSKLTASNGN